MTALMVHLMMHDRDRDRIDGRGRMTAADAPLAGSRVPCHRINGPHRPRSRRSPISRTQHDDAQLKRERKRKGKGQQKRHGAQQWANKKLCETVSVHVYTYGNLAGRESQGAGIKGYTWTAADGSWKGGGKRER